MTTLSTAPQAATASAGRMIGLDAARLVAAIAIVWLHTPESPPLAHLSVLSSFAVPFFVFTAVLLNLQSLRRNPDRPLGAYVVSRFNRIYVPFFVWSLLYFAFRDLKHIV